MDCIFDISGSSTIVVTASNLPSQSPNGMSFVFIAIFPSDVHPRMLFSKSPFFGQRPVISIHTWSTTPSRRISGDETTGVSRALYMTVIAASDGRFFRRVPREMSFPEFLRSSFHSCPVIRIYGARLFWVFREIPSCRLKNRRSKFIQCSKSRRLADSNNDISKIFNVRNVETR